MKNPEEIRKKFGIYPKEIKKKFKIHLQQINQKYRLKSIIIYRLRKKLKCATMQNSQSINTTSPNQKEMVLTMKIALAGMSHESNTFNKLLTGLESFNLETGELFIRSGRLDTAAAGFYEALIQAGEEVIPVYFARAIPSGPVKRVAYEFIKAQIIAGLNKNGPWDAVCLALHGSMAAEGLSESEFMYDPEGDLLSAIREITGYEIPIICSLDMHATVTNRMVTLSDGFTVFRTAPHIDEKDTGIRAANMLLKIFKEGRKTANTFIKIPFLVSGEQSETRVDPAKSLFGSLKEYDKLPNVLCASYLMGFPWADSPYGGAGALITGWADHKDDLLNLTKEMADRFWNKRADFIFSTQAMTPEEAIEKALKNAEYPLIISDSADNPTAGASQDTTRLLRLMINNNVENSVYTCIADPEAYDKCTLHMIGDMIELTIGGYYSKKQEEVFTVKTKLLNLAKSENTEYAVLQTGNVIFTVSEKRCATYKPQTLRDLNLEPMSFNVIGIKAGYLSPEYMAIGKNNILALTEGDTALELEKLPYSKTLRPIYPLDPHMVFDSKSI